MPLRDAVSKLKDMVDDLSSLHVQTFSGTVNLGVDAGSEAKKRFTQLTTVLKAEGADAAQVTLEMETLIRFDGDAYNFVAVGATEQIQQTHKDAVEAGIKTRQGLIDMVSDLL